MRVVFYGKTFPEAKRTLAPLLSEAGHELMQCVEGKNIHHLDDADVIIPAIARIGSDLIERGRFGLVQQFGVGLEGVDIEAATRFGVWVARVPSSKSGNAESVAEHALLLMLALSRKLKELPQSLEARQVGAPLGAALLHKTACIVGLGNIGTALSLRLHACGMRLLAVDDHPERHLPAAAEIERIFPLSELRAAVAEADYIVLCINYKASLHNLMDEAVLSSAKPGSMLINVARGGLVNPDALLAALKEDRLAGAGLDVFWEEPVDPELPLFRQNVIASPHIAGVTDVSCHGTHNLPGPGLGAIREEDCGVQG
jgi:phosphoglycerate dehydrogenase-like enzyme